MRCIKVIPMRVYVPKLKIFKFTIFGFGLYFRRCGGWRMERKIHLGRKKIENGGWTGRRLVCSSCGDVFG